MTRDEAKAVMRGFRDNPLVNDKEAFDLAIKALELQPCEDWEFYYNHGYAQAKRDLLCEDCISREALRQKLQERHDFFVNAYEDMPFADKARVDEISSCIAEVVNAPSVTPQPKTGHWITQYNVAHQKEYYYCSECREEYSFDGETGIKMNNYNYCPNCGVKMVEVY